MINECPMTCTCTYSSGCRVELEAATRTAAPRSEQPLEPRPERNRPQYPGIRSYALEQTAKRREARVQRRRIKENQL